MESGILKKLWSSASVERLFDSSGIGFVVIDPEMRIIDTSDAFCHMLEYTRDELLGLSMLDITHADEIRISSLRHLRSVSGEHIPPFDKRYLTKSGRSLWTRVRNEHVLDENGKLVFWLAMMEDISARKEEEIMLEQMAAITESSDDAIFRSDLNLNVEFWGKGAERLYGYTAEEIIGRPAKLLHGEPDPVVVKDAMEKVRAGETVFDPSSTGRHKNGHLIPISVMVFPIKDKSGRIVAYAATHRDISEMKQMEGQLLHAQRMETAGLLAGGVAHDFNNILTVILGSSTLLRDQLEPDSTAASQLSLIERAANKATRLTRQLLAFSSQQTVSPIIINPNVPLSEALSMLKSTLGDDIRIQTELSSTGTILLDPTQLEQLLLNVSINARHAMPDGGVLEISTRDVDYLQEPDDIQSGMSCHLPTLIEPGPYVLLSVSDSGTGMDPQTMNHIFDPFYTTKDKGAGTGLGLSVVLSIVTRAGGGVRVLTAMGKGTEFQIFLPRVSGTVEQVSLETTNSARQGKGTIVVLEDNEDVLALTVNILEAAGYKTLSFTNPRQLLASPPNEPVDLILSDVVMPEMNGPAFAEIWLQKHPEAKFLFMSGYFDESTFPLKLSERPLLLKPFKPSELLQQLQEILK